MEINHIDFSISEVIAPVVVLIGPPGSGKTEVGRTLAADLGWVFLDTDVLIEHATKLTISEIFAQYGQETFRLLEKKLVTKMAQLHSLATSSQGITNYKAEGTVISTGGGLPVLAENFANLSQIGTLIALYASIDVLVDRTVKKSNRPLLNSSGSNPGDYEPKLKLLIAERQHIYSQASLSIDTSNLTIMAVSQLIKQKLDINSLQQKIF